MKEIISWKISLIKIGTEIELMNCQIWNRFDELSKAPQKKNNQQVAKDMNRQFTKEKIWTIPNPMIGMLDL